MEMIFYSDVTLGHVAEDRVRASYGDWVLGEGAYRASRKKRLELGIDHRWSRDILSGSASLHGQFDCSLEVRRKGSVTLCKFSHRDYSDGAVIWHTFVQSTGVGTDATRVQHAVGRSFPRGSNPGPASGTPKILGDLVRLAGADVEPASLCEPATQAVLEDSVDGWLSHILLDADRQLPVVVVTATSETDEFLVPPERLGKQMAGIARTVVLTKAATFRLTDGLKERGFPRVFSCFDGAVRLYEPGIVAGDSPYRHPIWFASRLRLIEGPSRSDSLAYELSRAISETRLPRGFSSMITICDIDQRQAHARAVLEAAARPAPAIGEVEDARDLTIGSLREELSGVLEGQQWLEGWAADRENALAAEQRARADVEQQLEEQKQALSGLFRVNSELKAEQAAAGVLSAVLKEALRAGIAGDPTLEQALHLLNLFFPERVVVLASAWKSASRATAFKHRQKAFRLLWALATAYWETLSRGGGDAEAGKVLGAAYAATESELARHNERAIALRTFEYNGQTLTMLRHLKIGVKPSLTETFRCYFDWVSSNRQIVIGHCGEHLDLR